VGEKEIRQRHQPREVRGGSAFAAERSAAHEAHDGGCVRGVLRGLYLLRSGCQWRMLPSDFPKWRTVHSYFAKWSEPDQHGISVLERALKKSTGTFHAVKCC